MVQAFPKLITFEEFIDQYPDDGGIYELINGAIIPVNPTGKHEEIIAFLVAELNFVIRHRQLNYFLPRTCTVKPNTPNTGYKPDVLVLDRNEIVHEPLWEKASTITSGTTAPLIIEVVSTNWRDDYLKKLDDYELLGILEYWIIDYLALGANRYIGTPKQPTISVYHLVDGEYQLQLFRGSDRLNSAIFPDLQLTAEQVFHAGV
jgi:Uma2 family endonuclease